MRFYKFLICLLIFKKIWKFYILIKFFKINKIKSIRKASNTAGQQCKDDSQCGSGVCINGVCGKWSIKSTI